MAGGAQVEGHAQPAAGTLPGTLRAEASRRGAIMFSGATGAVVASGDGKATSDKSFGLVSDVTFVISELPDVLFDEHAEHRPCGKLDRCGARGMLACDLFGLPLAPWELAEPIGKEIHRLNKKIAEKKKKAKKAAKRRGEDEAAAAAAVLAEQVSLELPTPKEISSAWRQLAAFPAAPDRPSLQPPTTSAASDAPAPEPEPEPEPEPAEPEPEMDDRARAIIALTRSEKLGEAIAYAFWAMNERRFGMELATNGGLEMTLVGYKHALCELQEAHPGEFVNFKPEEPMRMVEWAVRCEVTGYSIPAAVAVAEQIGFPLQQVAADHAKRGCQR